MRQKKTEDTDMLITHKPVEPKDKAERTGAEERASAEPQRDSAALAARLAATTDPDERSALVVELQQCVGNREAERIIRSIRKAEDE